MALFGSGKRLAGMGGAMPPPAFGSPGLGDGQAVLQGAQPRALFGSGAGRAEAAQAIRQQLPPMNDPSKSATSVSPPSDGANQTPLGGSMRQGFDYEAAMQRLTGDKPKQSPWAIAAAVIGDALIQNSGGRPFAVQHLVSQRQGYQDRQMDAQRLLTDWQYRDYARQNEADLNASAPFTIGRDRVQYNPATGQTGVLFDGPEDFELYARELGLEPGTDNYFRAVEDYVLRSSGPSAHSRDLSLDDYRTGNDRELEALRFGNRQKLEGLRQNNRLETIRSRPAPVARGGGRTEAGQGGDGLPVVSSPADAARLPKGTRFRTPDGRVKVVP